MNVRCLGKVPIRECCPVASLGDWVVGSDTKWIEKVEGE